MRIRFRCAGRRFVPAVLYTTRTTARASSAARRALRLRKTPFPFLVRQGLRNRNDFTRQMTDTFTKEKRRVIMQAVRRQRTRPEEVLAGLLRVEGLRFRRNVATLPGKPDVYFPEARLAIFVHGCFWHGHGRCSKGRMRPKTNTAFWKKKVQRNQRRDHRVARQLRALGMSVYTVWECELSATSLPKRLLVRLHSPNTKGRPKCRSLPK